MNEANVSFEDSLIKSIGIELDTSKDLTTMENEITKGNFTVENSLFSNVVTENRPLIKKLYLNKGSVARISDQGLTPDRRLLQKESRLLKRIYINEGKVARISDHGLFSPLAKHSQ